MTFLPVAVTRTHSPTACEAAVGREGSDAVHVTLRLLP